ncbi:MAG: translocation/assembly module TamB domain-containing protein [Leptolyngbyaceae cyanobacterium]
MTQPPAADSQPTSPSPSPPPRRFLCLRRWQWVYLVLGGAIAISSSIGYWRLRRYVYLDLAPRIEQTLAQQIDRPIELGAVEGFSPFNLRFGASALPATLTDSDRATVEAINVQFNPLEILLRRQLSLSINLINPDIILNQDATGQWLRTRIKATEPGPIQINLAQINFSHTTVTLQPTPFRPSQFNSTQSVTVAPILLTEIGGQVRLRDQNRLIDLEVDGQTSLGGSFLADGTVDLDQYPLFQGRIETDRLPLTAFTPLGLVYLPPDLGQVTNGFLNAAVRVTLADPRDTANLNPPLVLQGRAEVWEMAVQLPMLAQPLEMNQATVLFRDQRINLRRVKLSYGNIRANANGQLHLQDGYDVTAAIPSAPLKEVLAAAGLDLPVETKGNLTARLRLTGDLSAPLLDATVTNKRRIVFDQIRFQTVQSRVRLTTEGLEIGTIEALPQLGGSIQGGGTILWGAQPTVDLTLALREVPGDDLLQRLLVRRLEQPLEQSLDQPPDQRRSRRNRRWRWLDPLTGELLVLGTVEADLDIAGPLNQLEAIAQFQAPEATFPTTGQAIFANQVLFVNAVETQFPQGRVNLDGRIDFAQQRWQAVAQVEELPLNQLPIGNLPFDQIPISQIPRNPVISTTALEELAENPPQTPQPQRQQGDRPSDRNNPDRATEPAIDDRTDDADSNSDNGRPEDSRPEDRNATDQPAPRADLVVPVQSDNVSGTSNSANRIDLDSGNNVFESEGGSNGNHFGEGADGGSRDGTATGNDTREAASRFMPTRVPPPKVGQLDGQISAAGTLASLRPEAITLNGQLQFSELPFLNHPLSTVFAWTGTQLRIADLSLPELTAYGAVNLRFSPDWRPLIGPFDFNLRIQELDLTEWELPISERIDIAGVTDFNGHIFGTLARPNVEALLQLDGLSINQVMFEPLVGPVRYNPDAGVLVDLQGDRDRIAAILAPDYRPVEFALNYGVTPQTITRVEGSLDPESGGDRLQTTIREFPLSVLGFDPAPRFQLGAIGGTVNADVMVDLAAWDWRADDLLDRLSLMGTVAIAQPRFGYLSAECFQGAIQLADGVADIRNGQLRLQPQPPPSNASLTSDLPQSCSTDLTTEESRYTLNGRLAATPIPSFKGNITIEQGQIQEWLQTFQLYAIRDLSRGLRPAQLGTADDITLVPLPFPDGFGPGPSNTTLLQLLQRYAEIIALREQQRRQRQTEFTLPQLQELAGTFSGTIDLTATPNTGLMATFDLSGANWQWGSYDQSSQVIAQGEFANGTITFLPLRFESGDSRLNFAGSVGWNEEATGRFQADNLSVAWLRQFFNLPLDIDGNLNAEAAITGNLQNPQARGNVILSNASLNRTPIQTAEASFSYADARLGVIGRMQIQDSPVPSVVETLDDIEEEAEPISLISLTGSLPYRLPFAAVEPVQNSIDLKIAARDDGIALLNLLNEHFFWEDGQGTVTLDVGGTLEQTDEGLDLRPTIVGTAQVQAATFSAQVLPAKLTQVTGDAQFDGDRITINTFQGQFSDGNFSASGVIPLLEPFTPEELAQFSPQPPNSPTAPLPISPTPPLPPPNSRLLAIDLNNLLVNFKGLYNGGVNGRIAITGTALKPQLSGGITLADGRVSLPDPTVVNQAAPTVADQASVWTGLIASPELVDLKVTLGRRLLITRLPLLNFVATGELIVNGPLQSDLRSIAPQGVITLHSGQVNVFTTQFNLDRRHNNVAIFTSRQGTDPFLNVRLETSVLEETRQSFPDDSILARPEIAAISANDFSQFQTVRIEAAVTGPASQLFNSIELSSSPSRSETEIVALIGGGFVDTLGRSEGFVSIANLAGTALFTRLQTLVSNAVGFSDLRIFPTVITSADPDEDDIQTAATLGLAAELGVKLTQDLSVSALQLLTVDEPTQYNLRYQINDELLLRGATNFSDESRIILEFETRF